MADLNKLGLCLSALSLALMAVHCNSSAPAPEGRAPGSSNGAGTTSGTSGTGSSTTGTDQSTATTTTASGGSGTTGSGSTTDATATTTGGGGTTGIEAKGGYYESGTWHGYAWTSPGEVAGTTVTPEDFATHEPGNAFCVSGSVAPDPDYGGVALLGFNVNQAQLPDEGMTDAAILDATPTGTGIAVNFSKAIGSTLRIQIQGLAGETDANDRWCYEIADAAGPVFAPYAEFNTECWTGGMGTAYAMQPISAVVFLVPGDNTEAVEYDYCIDGFADGNSVDDAPDSLGGGQEISGTLTGNDEKVKVVADGKSYIVQNNNWGSNAGSQSIDYVGNSFTVTQQTGGEGPGGEPASYPSIYLGANGFQGVNGSLTTTSDDGLPLQISSITSIQTTFSHNANGQDANAAYDVWFATSPHAGEYDDSANSGYLMVWLYDPANRQPIGSSVGNATVAGRNWDVWVGNRNAGTGAQVVSYVSTEGAIGSMTFDLNEFIQEAVNSGRGGFSGSWYLTDIFAGFEIWSGGTGLSVSEFSAVVQ